MADRIVRAVLTGSSAGAVKAFEETALAAEQSGRKVAESTEAGAARSSGAMSGLGGAMGKVLGGLAVGSLVLGGAAGYAAKVFGDYQASTARLNTALSDAGTKMTPQLTEQLDKTQASMARVGFDTSETDDSLSKLVAAGIPAKTAMQDIGVAADLARFKHIGLADATTMVEKASMGSARALRDLGITQAPIVASATSLQSAQTAVTNAQTKYNAALDQYGPKAKQTIAAHDALIKAQATMALKQKEATDLIGHYGGVVDLLQPKLKGQADAYAHTLPGALAVLKANVEDKLIVPLWQRVEPLLIRLGNWVGQHGAQIGAVIGAAMTVLTTAFSLAADAIGKVADVIGFVADHFTTLAPLLAGAAVAVGILTGGFGLVSVATGVWTATTGALSGAMGILDMEMLPVAAAIAGLVAVGVLLITHWDQVKAAAGAVWQAVTGFFTNLWHDVTAIVGAVIGWVGDHWMLLLGILTGPVGLAIGWVATHFSQIKDTIAGVLGDVVGFFAGLPGRVIGAMSNFGHMLGSFFSGLPGQIGSGLQALGGFLISGFKNAVDAAIIDPLNGALAWIGNLGGGVGPFSFHVRDAFGGHMPQIPRLTYGGEVLQTGLAVVHEGEVYSGVNGNVAVGGAGGGDVNVTIHVYGGDPQAVVDALRQYMQRNGVVPINVTAARRVA